MGVTRHRGQNPRDHFTILANAAIRDDRLSFRARGLLAYLTSLPDGYRVTAHTLAAAAKEGRAAILPALTELETCGYLRRPRHQDAGGLWSITYEVYPAGDAPVEADDDGYPQATGVRLPNPGLPNPGFPHPKRRTKKKNQEEDPVVQVPVPPAVRSGLKDDSDVPVPVADRMPGPGRREPEPGERDPQTIQDVLDGLARRQDPDVDQVATELGQVVRQLRTREAG